MSPVRPADGVRPRSDPWRAATASERGATRSTAERWRVSSQAGSGRYSPRGPGVMLSNWPGSTHSNEMPDPLRHHKSLPRTDAHRSGAVRQLQDDVDASRHHHEHLVTVGVHLAGVWRQVVAADRPEPDRLAVEPLGWPTGTWRHQPGDSRRRATTRSPRHPRSTTAPGAMSERSSVAHDVRCRGTAMRRFRSRWRRPTPR